LANCLDQQLSKQRFDFHKPQTVAAPISTDKMLKPRRSVINIPDHRQQ